VAVSGNYSYGDQIKRDKCIVHIAYATFESHSLYWSSESMVKQFKDAIKSREDREKVFLNYNRRARPSRCRLVYNLQSSGVIKDGFVSMGYPADSRHPKVPDSFYAGLPMPFDDTDLAINQASSFVERDFLNSYVSLVSETSVNPDEIFPTEKIFKPIVALHPFIVLASPRFLEKMREFGYKTFSKWFDESYDLEEDLEKRTNMIVSEIKKLTLMPRSELKEMLVNMLPTLNHNLQTLRKRTKEKTFQEQLEAELWK